MTVLKTINKPYQFHQTLEIDYQPADKAPANKNSRAANSKPLSLSYYQYYLHFNLSSYYATFRLNPKDKDLKIGKMTVRHNQQILFKNAPIIDMQSDSAEADCTVLDKLSAIGKLNIVEPHYLNEISLGAGLDEIFKHYDMPIAEQQIFRSEQFRHFQPSATETISELINRIGSLYGLVFYINDQGEFAARTRATVAVWQGSQWLENPIEKKQHYRKKLPFIHAFGLNDSQEWRGDLNINQSFDSGVKYVVNHSHYPNHFERLYKLYHPETYQTYQYQGIVALLPGSVASFPAIAGSERTQKKMILQSRFYSTGTKTGAISEFIIADYEQMNGFIPQS